MRAEILQNYSGLNKLRNAHTIIYKIFRGLARIGVKCHTVSFYAGTSFERC